MSIKVGLFFIISTLLFFNCTNKRNKEIVKSEIESKTQKLKEEIKKGRLEQVYSTSYRNLSVSNDLSSHFLSLGKLIWDSIYPIESEKVSIFKINGDDKIERINTSSTSISSIRKESYGLWQNKDFNSTAIVYESTTQDVTSGEEINVYVIEFEHESLTGTFYMFIPHKEEWNPGLIESTYVERN